MGPPPTAAAAPTTTATMMMMMPTTTIALVGDSGQSSNSSSGTSKRKRGRVASDPTETSTVSSSSSGRSAFEHFELAKREELARVYPHASERVVTAAIGAEWRALEDHERRPWLDLARFAHETWGPADHHPQSQQQHAGSARRVARGHAVSQSTETPMEEAAVETSPRSRAPTCSSTKMAAPAGGGPPRPRQPATPYLCYWKHMRPQVVAEHPKMAAMWISKEVGRRWRDLAEDERQVWKVRAAEDRRRYERELAANSSNSSSSGSSSGSVHMHEASVLDEHAVDASAIAAGFEHFLQHNLESLTLLHMTFDEFHLEMTALWGRMADGDKRMWAELAAHERRPTTTSNSNTSNHLKRPAPPTGDENTPHNARLEILKALASQDASAPLPPRDAFEFFASDETHQRVSGKHGTTMTPTGADLARDLVRRWETMDAYDRIPFIIKAERDADRFVRAMEAHLSPFRTVVPVQLLQGSSSKTSPRVQQEMPPLKKPSRASSSSSSLSLSLPSSSASGGGVKRRGGAKHKEAPRKPLNAYNIMCLERREELMVAYRLSHNECSALCGQLWRQMSNAERDQYQQKAREDKLRYERELQATTTSVRTKREPRGSHSSTSSSSNSSSRGGRTIKSNNGSGNGNGNDNGGGGAGAHTDPPCLIDLDPIRRLEESARVIFGAPEDHDAARGYVAPGPRPSSSTSSASARDASGFRYYVESKHRDRERWTTDMWLEEWESLAAPHRALWEELALEARAEAARRGTSDLDLLSGLVTYAGGGGDSPPFL